MNLKSPHHFSDPKWKLKNSMETIRSLRTVWNIFKDFLGPNMYSPVVSSSLIFMRWECWSIKFRKIQWLAHQPDSRETGVMDH